MFPSLPRPSRRLLLIFLSLLVPLYLEAFLHWRTFDIPRPSDDLDPPFYTGCQEPASEHASAPREKAVMVMLARNSDLDGARSTVHSVEDRFNRWFQYPYLFLNDEPWDPEFVRVLNQSAGGRAQFDVVPHAAWTFPEWVDEDAARQSIKEQGERGVHYGGNVAYHHMCRFFSGAFYNLDALRPYKWYWRLEPDVEFSCSITYDPFREMRRHRKVYGWTIALWEEPDTCPTLFRHMTAWKEKKKHHRSSHRMPPTTTTTTTTTIDKNNLLWRAIMSASWLPYPLRRWVGSGAWLPHHDVRGDGWSLCHYWSNFEIADLDFFRGPQYQELFSYLDSKGGFYDERWGDAAVHSLAVAMLAQPSQVHHFSDFAYRHGSLQQCPANAPGRQLEGSIALGDAVYSPETSGGVGCRCSCDASRGTMNYPGFCTNKLKQPTRPDRPWLTWFL